MARERLLQTEWIPYGAFDRRIVLSEVHECSYRGAPLTTIEYILNFEPTSTPASTTPGAPDPNIDEPFIAAVLDACYYLDAGRASAWIGDTVQRGGGIEHVPNLRSHCGYTGIHAPIGDARVEFKFHLFELFDTESLSPDQLLYHATFTAGGAKPTAVLSNPGKAAFVYEIYPNITLISVVTAGIQGPAGGDGRPRELLAHYYLQDEEQSHAQRLACLQAFAARNLELWMSWVNPQTNVVNPGLLPQGPFDECGRPRNNTGTAQ